MAGSDIGNQGVLAALSRTVPGGVASVDLSPMAATVAGPTGVAETVATPPEVDGEAEAPPASSAPPEGRFEARRELGRGGLGVVLEAYDHDLRRSVALKRPLDDAPGPKATSRLVREAQITAQLDHPNIPAVHALGLDPEGHPFFAMAFVRGRSLDELLRERAEDEEVRRFLTRGRLLRIFLQVGYAVAYAHERGVLHRDLKPDNVMIGAFGEVRLMDWGIAKILGRAADAEPADEEAPAPIQVDDARATAAGAIVGTLLYAAPEQLRGDGDLDGRADVYALGALLYTMLAGRPPVVAEQAMELVTRVVQGRRTPLASLVEVDKILDAIVARALATDREDRYPDVMALVGDVEAYLEGRAVSALDEGALERVGRFYMTRSPRLARLRFVDIDMMAWGCMLLGVSLGAWGAGSEAWWGWVALGLGAVATVPPVWRLMRKPRPEDPELLTTYGPLGTTGRSRDRTGG